MTTAELDGFAAYETFTGKPLPEDPIAAMQTLRHEVEREIERLLAFLDATDGNPDLEDDGGGIGDLEGLIEQVSGEPSLGATESLNQDTAWRPQQGWHAEDSEPEFASTMVEDARGNARPTRLGNLDGEPSLGSLTCVGSCRGIDAWISFFAGVTKVGDLPNAWNQSFWAEGDALDREPNGDEKDSNFSEDGH